MGNFTWRRYYIQAAAEELLSTDITDERANDDVCGLIAPESLRRSEIEDLIDDAIDEATDDVLRYSEQTLETTEQDQARENIDAMKRVGESTQSKKETASGDTEDAVAGEDYGIPAVERTATLAAASWSGSGPYTQSVAVSGMTSSKKAIVGLAMTATTAQYEAAADAGLRVTSQGTDTITVTAEGGVRMLIFRSLLRLWGDGMAIVSVFPGGRRCEAQGNGVFGGWQPTGKRKRGRGLL